MNISQQEQRRHQQWLNRILRGLSFEEACRVYVLKARSPQYLAVQPIPVDEIIEGRRIRGFQKAMKHFCSEDPTQKHCYSREELISEAARLTGLPDAEACSLLHQLFAFQPELTYCERGAVCREVPVSGFESAEIDSAAIPYDTLKRSLPDQWYVSLQIPEPVIEQMVWAIRKAGSSQPHPCSSRFAEQVLRLYKRRRGEFIRKYSFETLRFFWLEYASMKYPRHEVEKTVRHTLDLMRDPEPDRSSAASGVPGAKPDL